MLRILLPLTYGIYSRPGIAEVGEEEITGLVEEYKILRRKNHYLFSQILLHSMLSRITARGPTRAGTCVSWQLFGGTLSLCCQIVATHVGFQNLFLIPFELRAEGWRFSSVEEHLHRKPKLLGSLLS